MENLLTPISRGFCRYSQDNVHKYFSIERVFNITIKLQQLEWRNNFIQSTITVMQVHICTKRLFKWVIFKMGFKLHLLITTNYSYFIIMRLLGFYKKLFLEIPRNTIQYWKISAVVLKMLLSFKCFYRHIEKCKIKISI